MWPELAKARENSRKIDNELARLVKKQNALFKKEITAYDEQLLSEIDEATQTISDEFVQMIDNLKNHRRQVAVKSSFLTRHHKWL